MFQQAGVKEGCYIVSVNGEDCRWSKHADVVQLLKSVGKEGVDIDVVTFQNSDLQNMVVDKKSSMLTSGELLKGNKDNSRKTIISSRSASTLLMWNKKSNASKGSSTFNLPFSAVQNNESMY
ncbi:hypothetical protein FKM82_005720 [Ascaphus truei]